jgi:putative copper resistance protein D
MDALLAAVRALHFAAAILLFGQFVHRAVVAPEGQLPRAFARVSTWAILVFFVSAVLWLGLEAVSMSGLPPAEALGAGTLTAVATHTLFGRVWLARVALASALALTLVVLHRRPAHRGAQISGAALAALVLASIAGEGHALAGRGIDRAVHLCLDGLHLLAAGAWLGALVPLIGTLSRASTMTVARRAAQRFSTLGIAAVAAILLSGIVNACYMLPNLDALASSLYGRILLAKILLFLAILGLAGTNRIVLTPRLATGAGTVALRRLRANAIIECVLGLVIVAIAGQLGITMPEFHHHH